MKFRKRLTKFKITIALPKKFGSKGFITVVKVKDNRIEQSICLTMSFI